MGEVRRTLIPQFSLRLILGIISVLAVAASVVSPAGRGWAWAAGVSIGLLAIAVAFVVYSVLFGVAWLFSLVIARGSRKPTLRRQRLCSARRSFCSISARLLMMHWLRRAGRSRCPC